MILKIIDNTGDLSKYLLSQIENYFPIGFKFEIGLVKSIVRKALERTEYCFCRINNKYYNEDGNTLFNPLNGDQYASFLYFVSNEAYKEDKIELSEILSYLNKILHAIDLFGHIEMPQVFQLVHPLGSIIGRASFQNYLIIYQNVTIGGVHTEGSIKYPSFGEGIVCYSNTSILGSSKIGDNVAIGSNTNVINTDIKADSVVTGIYPNLRIRDSKELVKKQFFIQ